MKTMNQEQKQELFKQYREIKKHKIIRAMVEHSEDTLTRLVQEDERDDFLSRFTSQSKRAKRLGERKQLRQLVKNFK